LLPKAAVAAIHGNRMYSGRIKAERAGEWTHRANSKRF
jgi:hypothetical protein